MAALLRKLVRPVPGSFDGFNEANSTSRASSKPRSRSRSRSPAEPMLSEQGQRLDLKTPPRGVFQRNHSAVANADVARTLAGSLQRAVQLLRDAERFAERGTVSA